MKQYFFKSYRQYYCNPLIAEVATVGCGKFLNTIIDRKAQTMINTNEATIKMPE